MPYYESVFIARQDISAAQAEALADGYAKLIEEQGGRIARREHWGLRSLSYRIAKNRKGHYVLFNFEAPAGTVSELERQMRISEDVIRYMTLRTETLEEGPSVMTHGRSGADRPRRGDDRPRRGDDRPRRGEGEGPRDKAPANGEEGTQT